MAKEKENELELEEPSNKKKKIIIIIAVVVLLAGGGGGAFFFMGGDDPAPKTEQVESEGGSSAEGEETKVSSSASVGTALYVRMPRAFRFNVPGAARDRFVEIRVELLVRGGDNEELAKKHVPLIESTLLGVFSQSNADDLATSAGKSSLKQKALAAVQQEMRDVTGEKVVEQVLFTGFVMQ